MDIVVDREPIRKGPDAAYLCEQSAKCRRLADVITDDSARVALLTLAVKYELKANDLDPR
jgi:hypothetical protein